MYARHRNKNNPLFTLSKKSIDTRYRRYRPGPTHPILVRKSSYWLFSSQDLSADAYTNFTVHEARDNRLVYSARYIVSGMHYNLAKCRDLQHFPPWYLPYVIYEVPKPMFDMIEGRTEIYYYNSTKRLQNTEYQRQWYMPLRTVWIIPEGPSWMFPEQIGLYNIMEVVVPTNIIDVTFRSSNIQFKAKSQAKIEIYRVL